MQCTNKNVFADATNTSSGDQSLGPAQDGVLQHVIEYTNNTIIGVGGLDYLLPINGTLLALQNTTWNGLQGFQSSPFANDFFVPYHPEYNEGALAGAGYLGTYGVERGLTFYTVQLSGHGTCSTIMAFVHADISQNYPNMHLGPLTGSSNCCWVESRHWVRREILPRRRVISLALLRCRSVSATDV